MCHTEGNRHSKYNLTHRHEVSINGHHPVFDGLHLVSSCLCVRHPRQVQFDKLPCRAAHGPRRESRTAARHPLRCFPRHAPLLGDLVRRHFNKIGELLIGSVWLSRSRHSHWVVLAGSCVPVDPCVASGESALHEMVSLDPALSGRHLGTGLLNHWLGVFLRRGPFEDHPLAIGRNRAGRIRLVG